MTTENTARHLARAERLERQAADIFNFADQVEAMGGKVNRAEAARLRAEALALANRAEISRRLAA
jgi:hypothetical protein